MPTLPMPSDRPSTPDEGPSATPVDSSLLERPTGISASAVPPELLPSSYAVDLSTLPVVDLSRTTMRMSFPEVLRRLQDGSLSAPEIPFEE